MKHPMNPPTVSIFTNLRHGITWETYASDDEPTYDIEPEFDRFAYERWRDGQIDDWYFN